MTKPTKEEAEIKKLNLEADLLRAKLTKIEVDTEAEALELEARKMEMVERTYLYAAKQAQEDRCHRYSFFGEVSNSSVGDCISHIEHWHRIDPDASYELVLNSPGGNVFAGLALYDDIMSLRDQGHSFKIITRGMAASMGAIILQAADERVIGKNSHVLIHEISTGAIGKLSEIEDEAKFAEQLSARLLDILAERSTLTQTQIKRKWKRKDWWLGAQEAVDLGFADRIG